MSFCVRVCVFFSSFFVFFSFSLAVVGGGDDEGKEGYFYVFDSYFVCGSPIHCILGSVEPLIRWEHARDVTLFV